MVFFPRISRSSEDSLAPPKSPMDNTLSPRSASEPDLSEGGVDAWCTVLGAFIAQFCGFGYTNAFGVYQAFYAQQYLETESASAISWIGSLATLLVTAIGLVCGPLFDNGYFHHVFIGGAILQSLSIFMLSLVQSGNYYQVFLAQGVTSGIGESLGGVVHTIMLNKLLNGRMGFKIGVRISAAFVTVLLLLSCVLVRPRYNAVRQETTAVNFWKAMKKCFTEMPSLLTILGFTLFQVAYMYPYFYFQVDSLRHGLSVSISFYSLVIINAGSFVGRFAAGFLLPFIGVVEQTILTTILCGILSISMIWLGSAASVVTLGVLYGFISGMNIAMMAPMLGLKSDPAELGVRMGVGFAITGVGDLVGSPICGALLTDRYVWWAPALFCGVISLAGGVLFIGVRILLLRAARVREGTGGKDNGEIVSRSERKGVSA